MSQDFYLKQLEVGPMENFVYLIGDQEIGECIMIDPAWDVQSVLKQAEADGMKVVGGLVTHTHFDHVNGAKDLLGQTKSKLYVNKNEAGFLKEMQGEIVSVDSGYVLEIGKVKIEFLHTPGHTPGSQCFLVRGHLVSGDTLFISACGRCDLPGGNPAQMYESLQRLAKLRDDTVLLPGHNYADIPQSTMAQEKRENPYYQIPSLQDFLNLRMR